MRITGAGNVGIGTPDPTKAKLEVNASSIAGIYLMGDYTDYNYILNAPPPGYTTGGAVHFINSSTRTSDGGANCYTVRNDSGPIRLGQENQITTIEGSDVILNSNVGIGTTDPAAKLEVNGTTTAHTNTTPTNPSCLIYSDHGGETLWIGHPNHTQGIQLGYNTIKKWTTPGSATNDHLYFNISGSTDMVIHKGGNVGIGTTSPDHKLEIYESTWFVRLCMESSSTGKLLLGTHNDGRVFLYNEKKFIYTFWN